MTANPKLRHLPEISVLMSAYNSASYLHEAIESILAQTFSNFELIVIDDASADNSWDIISQYAKQDKRVITLQNSVNLGASGALNRGLRLARGQYITRQDSDDSSYPSRLALQLEFLKGHSEIGAVGCAVELIDDIGLSLDTITYPSSNEEIQLKLTEIMCFCGPTVMVTRQVFSQAGYFFDDDLSGSEDYDLCLRVGEVARLANLGERLYRYRQHGASVSQRHRARQMARQTLALERAVRRRYGITPDATARNWIARDHLRTAVLAYMEGEIGEATLALQRALTSVSTVLDSTQPLEKILRRYTARGSTSASLELLEGIFKELLPRRRSLSKLRSRLISEVHMREVFRSAELTQPRRVRSHLWPALRQDPRWLLNRGVLSMLVKSLVRRHRGWMSLGSNL